jgi:uncharacterized protein YqgC (DUF456 family)
MPDLIPFILLIAAFIIGLLLIPLGLPGLWLMVVAVFGYAAFGRFEQVGWVTITAVLLLAAVAEGLEAWLGFRFTKRYGASNRAGWGAMIGGLIGAVVGTPVPIIGNVIGAFVGAFAGAVVGQYTVKSEMQESLGAGWGAVLGRATGAAVKIAVGFAIAIIAIFAAVR